MIKIENVETYGWEAALRGMRNPLQSHSKSDTGNPHEDGQIVLGAEDYKLMRKLVKAGTDHAKFMRMIGVSMDIVAPDYWFKEFSTYRIGVTENSTSTMHRIHAKEFTLEDFSHEHIFDKNIQNVEFREGLETIIELLNEARECYLDSDNASVKKLYWWQMIQLLPMSYNYRRTVSLNYAVLRNMYHARKNHKLDEWHTFCTEIEKLPYSALITM